MGGAPVRPGESRQVRVLLVDDNPDLVRITERVLKRAGMVVECAWDGITAADLVRRTEFDVVVSDVAMPGLDGLALLRAVRERDLDVPVILVTGAPDVQAASHAIEYGAFRYLTKPIELSVLARLAEEAAGICRISRLNRQILALHGAGAQRPSDRGGLDASLDRALRSMRIVFQPVVEWRDHKVFAYEALLRSHEPSLPNPEVLFEAAERAGRLAEVSRAVRAATVEAAERSDAQYTFMNIHPRDLLDDELYDRRTPLGQVAGRIALEITERARLDEVRDLSARIQSLRAMGFKIAVDDLGAGYSGLTSFARLEPEIVKIDMSLVRDIEREPMQSKLVASLASLCKDTGRLVVAEGVETLDERDALIACGCDLLQGYLFARPGPPFPAVEWSHQPAQPARLPSLHHV
jgi:EAL domain-containing protein (putative c-di-GMP-specific phosphodiesterase class I)/ActR/RegA family two-component response regulator